MVGARGETLVVNLPGSPRGAAESLAARLQAMNRDDLLVMARRARKLGRLQAAAAVADAIEQQVQPAYQRYYDFFTKT